MIRSDSHRRNRDRAQFATKYTLGALTFIFAIFVFSYLPGSSVTPEQYRHLGIDPRIFISRELWIVLGMLWLGVFFKPRYFIFW